MPTRSLPFPLVRFGAFLRIVLLSVGLATVLGGGCTWRASSGDDDDCDEDDDGDCDEHDDDGGVIIIIDASSAPDGGVPPVPALDVPELPAEAYALVHWRIERGESAGRPWRRVVLADGPALGALWGPGSYDAAQVAAFTLRVRAANPELLDVPRQEGAFAFERLERTGDLLAADWRVLDAWGRPLPDARQVFLFDALGTLLAIEDGF